MCAPAIAINAIESDAIRAAIAAMNFANEFMADRVPDLCVLVNCAYCLTINFWCMKNTLPYL